jgi:nitrate/nitrite transporter NarK
MTSFAIAGIVGGPIAGLIMNTMGGIYGLANWQWVFILEGIPSVLAGIAVILYLPDKPEEASWRRSCRDFCPDRGRKPTGRQAHEPCGRGCQLPCLALRADLLLHRERQRNHCILDPFEPQSFLAGTAAAGAIAAINSIGNLAGFVAPYAVGLSTDVTGSTASGLYFVGGLELLAAILVFSLARWREASIVSAAPLPSTG